MHLSTLPHQRVKVGLYTFTYLRSLVKVYLSYSRVSFFTVFVSFSALIASAQVVINEVVTDPQQDWSTNGFNGIPGADGVTDIDEWIELYITADGLNLTGWTIEVTDGGSFSGDLTSRDITGNGAFQNTTYFGNGSFINTQAGDYLVLGNPQSNEDMTNSVYIVLRDNNSIGIDSVELGNDPRGDGLSNEGPDGNSIVGIDDESVGRISNGKDTNNNASDFQKVISTMGAENGRTIVFVDASATDDTGLGTLSDPKQLIQSGIDLAVSGGTVNVASGSYNESIVINKALTLNGANQGTAGSGGRGTESILEPSSQGNGVEINADNVIIDGFQIGVTNIDAGIFAISSTNVTIQNNIVQADSVGIALVGATSGSISVNSNQITISDFITGSSAVTSGVLLSGLTGSVDVDLEDNEYSGGAQGISVFDCLSSNVLSLVNETVMNAIRGMTVSSVGDGIRASSTLNVDTMTVSAFDEPSGGILGFPQTGIYFFTDGPSTDAHSITATVSNSTFSNVGNSSSDYAGIICGDFSSTDFGAYLQDITINQCTFSDNENRGTFVRGRNTRASINRCTYTNNGFDPIGTSGNFGFNLVVRNNAEVSVSNTFFISPSDQANSGEDFTFRGLSLQAGGSLSVSNSLFDNNENSRGLYVANTGIDLSGNHFSTVVETDIDTLVNGNDFTPWYSSGTDSDVTTPGFQPDALELIVGTLGAQTTGGRLQEAQDLISTDGMITVLSGAYNETLIISKDLTIDPGAGTSINVLELNGGRLTVMNDLEIGTFNLSDGILDADLDDGIKSDDPVLTLNNPVSGTPSSLSHIEGRVRTTIAGTASFSFPVGDEGSYRPVTLTPTNESTFTVSHIEDATPGDINTDLLNSISSVFSELITQTLNTRYWDIDVSSAPGDTDVALQLSEDDGATDPNTIGITRFNGVDWIEMTRIDGTGFDPFIITGQTSDFSEFTVYTTDGTSNPLPVELVGFKGQIINNDALLTWSTLTEVNADYFQVERSDVDSDVFESIGNVQAHGNSSDLIDYSFLDQSFAKAQYYRLKTIDFDGSYEYSETILVTPDLDFEKLFFYPNPSKGTIGLSGLDTDFIKRLAIHSLDGRLQRVIYSIDSTSIDISDLSTGQYIIQLELIDGQIFKGQILKD